MAFVEKISRPTIDRIMWLLDIILMRYNETEQTQQRETKIQSLGIKYMTGSAVGQSLVLKEVNSFKKRQMLYGIKEVVTATYEKELKKSRMLMQI